MDLFLSLFILLGLVTLSASRPAEKDLLMRELEAELKLVNEEINRRRLECPECYPKSIYSDYEFPVKKRTEYGKSFDFYRYLGMGKRRSDVEDFGSDEEDDLPAIQYRSTGMATEEY